MSFPPVSVVMSVFNGQAFLAEAIESILGQTYRDYEFVIIDDGSTDKTAEILERYSARDARIHVHKHHNKGRATSLNIGMELSKGLYIARMDADDIALPNRLRDQFEFLERHPEVGLLGGGVELVNSAGKILATYRPILLEDSEIKGAMAHRNTFYHPAVLMRKKVMMAAGGYRKVLVDADDYDLWLRIGERSQFANIREPVLRYRIHANQVSVRNIKHQTLCVLAARAAASLRKRGLPDPLWQIEEITPQVLYDLGVTPEEIQRTLLRVQSDWMEFLPDSPEAALQLINGFLDLSVPGLVERPVVANAWLAAAGIHYKQGRPISALVCVGRAVLTRPIVVGRPIKRALAQIVGMLK